jgi:putative acetyltransferase
MFLPEDAPALLNLFRDTVRRINARDYSAEQIAAWASEDIDNDQWRDRFLGRFAVVAEAEGQIAGFAELEPDGHIDRFFVSADHQRIGVGRVLLNAIVAEAHRLQLSRLLVDASITARPFFESRGFVLLESRIVHLRGVDFRNFRMAKSLDSSENGSPIQIISP